MALSYCQAVAKLPKEDLHRVYHDTQYGFPITDDAELFGRLILEINQAGLSWTTILKKQQSFREAYSSWNIVEIAAYDQTDIDRLLANSGIIRNRLKIKAAITNAQKVLELQKSHGSFKLWLDTHKGYSLEEWTKLFRSQFSFVGGEIVKEFLISTAYLPGAHDPECPIHRACSNLTL